MAVNMIMNKPLIDSEYAKYCLGTIYQRGYYVEQFDTLAFEYFDRSSKKGNLFASYVLGTYYIRETIFQRMKLQLLYIMRKHIKNLKIC